MRNNIGSLQQIYDKVTELNRKNNLLKAKYENDAKYVRMHKRIMENGTISKRESAICETLMEVKAHADERVLKNTKVLDNESYFEKLLIQMVIGSFSNAKMELDPESAKFINSCLVKEYMNEYLGTQRW